MKAPHQFLAAVEESSRDALLIRPVDRFVLGVVILAAGRSSRMGQPKLLLPWGDTSVLGHLLRQWHALEARQIAVVCARGDPFVQAELQRLNSISSELILNPTPDQGMYSSIQCAAVWAGWNASLTHWAIVLGDQPHLRQATLRSLVSFCVANPEQICQPSHQGRPRHPVLLPKTAFGRLAGSPALTLREFLLAGNVAICELPDPGLNLDLDTPEEYAVARIQYEAQDGP
jgi:molybdenum cofactor cytidylyltransferase